MAADIFRFDEFASSGRGLLAAVMLPQNRLAVAADVATISYEVKNITDGGASVTGSVPLSTMYAAPQEWDRDDVGYTWAWAADGSLWPLANKIYGLVVTFTTVAGLGPIQFKIAFQINTKDPFA